MPNFYAHLLFGREVSKLLSPARQRTLLRQWDSFCCGNFGPDPLYFYVGSRHGAEVRQAGIRLHHGSGRTALEAYRQPVKEGRPYAVAFAAGYLLHYALDSRMHPYVLSTVAKGQVTHFALEGEFDRYLLRRDGQAYPDALPRRPVTREMLAAASCMAPEVNPRVYEIALRRFRMVSCRIGSWAGGPMRHVINAASFLPPARGIRGSIPEPQLDPEMRARLREMEQIFRGAVPEAAKLLEDCFQAMEEDRPLPEGLDRDYSGNEVVEHGVY